MQRPDDLHSRKSNYDRARACVAACWPFEDPAREIRSLLEAAQVAYLVLPNSEPLRAQLGAILEKIEGSETSAAV